MCKLYRIFSRTTDKFEETLISLLSDPNVATTTKIPKITHLKGPPKIAFWGLT
jgi:spore germination protein GerM